MVSQWIGVIGSGRFGSKSFLSFQAKLFNESFVSAMIDDLINHYPSKAASVLKSSVQPLTDSFLLHIRSFAAILRREVYNNIDNNLKALRSLTKPP